jgi:antitoxin component YwqK of YwqJK toxin-antitoxin module
LDKECLAMKQRERMPDPQDGKWSSYFSDGQKMIDAEFKSGKREGLLVLWHPGGTKMMESEWRDGELHGRTTIWAADGTRIHEIEFERGLRK